MKENKISSNIILEPETVINKYKNKKNNKEKTKEKILYNLINIFLNGELFINLTTYKYEEKKLDNTIFPEIASLITENKDLLQKISEEEFKFKIININDKIMVDIEDKSNWRDFVNIVCNNIEEIKKCIKINRVNDIRMEENNELKHIKLQDLCYYYLVYKKIFLSNLKETCTITANIYETYYKVKKEYIPEKFKHIFGNDEEINIQEFMDRFHLYLLNYFVYNGNKFKDIECNDLYTISDKEIDSVDINKLEIPKNILLKGVPGTGKSRAIDRIIKEQLKIDNNFEINQTLRINIHSDTSNSDLMQGIGVYTNDKNIIYKEKNGIILKHLLNAIKYPKIPFVLVLEEIQENSLNELIGDLIYLIEEDKRVDVSKTKYSHKSMNIFSHIEYIIKENKDIHYVTIPYLIEDKVMEDKKIIFPNNLYVFCTSNYREDKRIIEDNLFRRFEIIDIFPSKEPIKNEIIKDFFEKLNFNIIKEINDDVHRDRFLVGHSNWINVNDENEFIREFIKLINEFKEIREVEFVLFKDVIINIRNINNNNDLGKNVNKIIGLVKESESYYDILKELYKNDIYKYLVE